MKYVQDLLAELAVERLPENLPRPLADVLADRLRVRAPQQLLDLLGLDGLVRLEPPGDAPVALRHERLVGEGEGGQVQQRRRA